MMLKVQLVRAIQIKAEQLLAIANLTPAEKANLDSITSETFRAQEIDRKIREIYGPMALRFKLYWPGGIAYPHAIATMEVAAFEVKDSDVPHAGMMTADALSEKETLLTDGALTSELCRIGVFVDAKDISWRIVYQTSGN
jgi:hypothetical protein